MTSQAVSLSLTHTIHLPQSLSPAVFSSLSNRPLSRLPLCCNHSNQPCRSAHALCLPSDYERSIYCLKHERLRVWLQRYFALIYCCRCVTQSGVHLGLLVGVCYSSSSHDYYSVNSWQTCDRKEHI